jgi:GNAT superfamily N-acetyltransferase
MIKYTAGKRFSARDLEDLFLSVEWESGRYPQSLRKAMARSHGVISAWDGKKLVGLVNCLSDGSLVAYFHYLVVRPEYQGQGIGRRLMEIMFDTYRAVRQKVLIADDRKTAFYEKFGLEKSSGFSPMHHNEF